MYVCAWAARDGWTGEAKRWTDKDEVIWDEDKM